MEEQVRVLIVDDCRHARIGLRALLMTVSMCRVVAEAATSREAIDIIPFCKPDLVFMDVETPGMDGLEGTRAIKQVWPDVRVVILTLHAERRAAALAAGADAFVCKCDGPAQVLATLDSLCVTLHAGRFAAR